MREFSLSLGIHILLLAVVLLSTRIGSLFKAAPQVMPPSVRVDVVGMPTKTLQELKRYTSVGNKTIESPSKDKSVPEASTSTVKIAAEKKKSSSLQDFLKQKAQQGSKSKRGRGRGNGKKGERAKKRQLNRLLLKGNKVSRGSALWGESREKEQSDFERYAEMVRQKTRQFWSLPSYLAEESWKCQIKVYVNRQGKVIKLRVKISSGNQEFDQRAMASIKQAAPFEAPQQHILKRVVSGDLVLAFPL